MSSTDFHAIIDTIFAHGVFQDLDKKALVDRYDTTGAIDEINSTLGSVSGQEEQTGNVISSIPPQGIVIKTPGTYTFAADLTWQPGAVASAAIVIEDTDNVTLDLSNHVLAAIVGDSGQHITGICIKGASSVTIQNGTLAGMCYYGIRAEEVENLTIQNLTVSGLAFKNLDIRNLCPAGIHVNHALGVKITDCTVQYMYVTADSSAGIQLLSTVSGTVSGCRVSNLVNYDGSVQGYSYVGSVNVTTANCTAEDFQSCFGGNIRNLGHTVLGFCPIFCLGLKYESCSATGMTGCSDDCHGMSVFLNAMVAVDNFTASFVTDGVDPSHTGAKSTGLEVYGAFVSVRSCSVENIKAIVPQDRQSTGFSAWGVAISFTNCKAGRVTVCDQNGHENPDLGYGTGFGWAPDPRAMFRNVGAYLVTYQGCAADHCQVGFDTWYHVDSTWTDISHTDCGIGVLVQPGETRTLSGNPASECNPPITVVIKNIARGNTYPGS